eukprot:6179420-Pleurochrysis_carterae.AAC.1
MGRRSWTCTREAATLASSHPMTSSPPRYAPTMCATRAAMAATLLAARFTATARCTQERQGRSRAQGLRHVPHQQLR